MIWTWDGARYQTVNLHNTVQVPVFIVCNGPSFAEVDANRLRGPGRIVIGVNNVYPRLKPDFWFGMDAPENFDRRLFWEPFPKICRAKMGDRLIEGRRLRDCVSTWFCDCLESASFWDWSRCSVFEWSKNSFLMALQFALWLGGREIYFVGTDLSHERGDYADGDRLSDAQRARNDRLHTSTLSRLEEFAQMSKTMGIRLAVTSQHSRLARFLPQHPIESVLASIERAIPSGRLRSYVTAPAAPEPITAPEKRLVALVLRSGGIYKPEHANRLIAQLRECEIAVLTDLPAAQIHAPVIPLRHDWPGWWSKMEMFHPDIFPGRPFLYLDLDSTVFDLPTSYFTHPRSLALCPFTPKEYSALPGYHQSGMMLLHPADRAQIWSAWIGNSAGQMARHRGDQDFLHACRAPFDSWQAVFPNQIASYKMNWLPSTNEHGKPLHRPSVKVLCFHGKPKPWDLEAAGFQPAAASAPHIPRKLQGAPP